MKKTIALLLTLLLVLTMAVGCSQDNKKTETTANETTETTNKNSDKKAVSDLFGIPQETDDYLLWDITDTNNPDTAYFLEQLDEVFGIEGYRLSGEGKEGSNFCIYASENEAFVFKSIDNIDGKFIIVLSKVKPGTQYAQEKAYLIVKKPFTSYSVKYEDGTDVKNIDILADEAALLKNKGAFQKAEGNQIEIIPEGATLAYTYTLDGVPANALEGLKKNDVVEYMSGQANDKVYSIRKATK